MKKITGTLIFAFIVALSSTTMHAQILDPVIAKPDTNRLGWNALEIQAFLYAGLAEKNTLSSYLNTTGTQWSPLRMPWLYELGTLVIATQLVEEGLESFGHIKAKNILEYQGKLRQAHRFNGLYADSPARAPWDCCRWHF